jgi:acetoin utilization protein AcuB
MKTNLVTISPEDSLKKVREIFDKNKIHHLPVIDEGKLVGMLSKSDFLFFQKGFQKSKTAEEVEEFRMKTHRVKEIMTKGIGKISPDDRINVALEVFKENMFHAIPVVDDGYLKGIVTTLDIIQHLADDTEITSEYQ